MADACSYTSIILRPVVIETRPGGVQKTGILVQLQDGPEKVCIVMRSDSSRAGTVPGMAKLIGDWQGRVNQRELLSELYRQDMVMHQLRDNFDAVVRTEVGDELVSIGRFKYGADAETFLGNRRKFLNAMEEAGDDGEEFLDDIMKNLSENGWTENMVDPEMVVLGRQLAHGKEPIMETTDAYGLAQDFNPDEAAIEKAIELTREHGYPNEPNKWDGMTDAEIAEELRPLILQEMHKELYGGDPKHSCIEIVLSGVRSVDEIRTVRRIMDDPKSWASRHNKKLRKEVMEFEQELANRRASAQQKDFIDQLTNAETPEELDLLSALVHERQLGVEPGSVQGIEMRNLIERKRGLQSQMTAVVDRLKSKGYTFHHSAKVRPTKVGSEGFRGGLVTEMQIVKQEAHTRKFRVEGRDQKGNILAWTPDFKAHFGGCGVYYYLFGIYCK